jgi:tRNA A-37 threonylcarbamoyl transferase component Bud32
MDLGPEQRIRRKLVLVRLLGEGGMAKVWVADDLQRKRRVAVKVLRSEFAHNKDVVERFISEAKVIGSIQSPHVPKVLDSGTLSDGTPFMVMELMEGDDLEAYLRDHGPLSLRATARLVSQIAAALEAAHRVGVVHRDVKAENIFVLGEGENLEAKLFDFGIAKMPSERHHTRVGVVMGTPGYMSPEQLESATEADHRADFWALGVVAYVALAGKLPFQGETFVETCSAVRLGVYDLPSHLRPELPAEVDAWFAKALHADANARFQTASELSASLVAIVLGDRGAAGPEGDLLMNGPATVAVGRHSVGGVSRTRGAAHAPRGKPFFLTLAAVGVASVVYSIAAARADDRVGRAWAALTTAQTATASPTAQTASPTATPIPTPTPTESATPTAIESATPTAAGTALATSSPPGAAPTEPQRPQPHRTRRAAPPPPEFSESALADMVKAAQTVPRHIEAQESQTDSDDAGVEVPRISDLPVGFGTSRD